MLTEICAELKNYFCSQDDILINDYTIQAGRIAPSFDIQDGQYYRIVNSVFNDGVHKYGDPEDVLKDEATFHGAVWLMRVPPDVVALAKDISDWQAKYGGLDGVNMSPFTSESFGGYSYSKGATSSGGGTSSVATWKSVFADRLSRYRRIRVL